MKLSEAKAQVEREHPEFDGSAKLAAIKALRQANPDEDRGHLTGIAWLVIALDWWTFVGMCIAIAGLFAGIGDAPGVFWPAEIQPGWLGVLLGFIGFFALTGIYGVLEEHGKTRRTTGPAEQPSSPVR